MNKIIFIFFFLIAGMAYSQPYTLTGYVVDSVTNVKLSPGFSYWADGYSSKNKIDSNGFFHFERRDSLFELELFHCGYHDRKIQLNLQVDSSIVVRMRPSEEFLEEFFFVLGEDTVYYNECSEINGTQGDFVLRNEYLSCNGKPCNGLVKTYYISGQLKEVAAYVEGKVHDGQYLSYYENGNLKQNSHYINGERVGQWISYHENGLIKSIWKFNSNGNVSTSLGFGENGALIDYRIDSDDPKCLIYSTDFYDNGRIRSSYYQASCENDSLYIYKLYYPNGVLNKESQILGPFDEVVTKYYDQDGIWIKTEYVEDGNLIRTELLQEE